MNKSVQDASSYIISKKKISTSLGIITGSGWDLSSILENKTEIPYKEIPGFPSPTVEGHKGRIIHGSHSGREVILLQGRVHYYEGYSMEEVTFPVEALSALGVKYMIITNAAGGINADFKPGDFMAVMDHINLMGVNPLRGRETRRDKAVLALSEAKNVPPIACFVDMSEAYDRALVNKAVESGTKLGINVHSGILSAVAGPSYETPAEIHMMKTLGADAVCMSTIPEVIMGRYLGMKVLAISIITNYAAGISALSLRHEDVISTAGLRSKDACRLVSAVIENMPR